MLLYGSDEQIHVKYKNRYGRQRAYYTTYEGVLPNVERRHRETESEAPREKLEQFMREIPCRACKGAAAAAGDARGHGRRAATSPSSPTARSATTLAFVDGDRSSPSARR